MLNPPTDNHQPIQWLDTDRTVLLCQIPAQWTWEEVHQAVQRMDDLSAGIAHPIYRIIYWPGTDQMPPPEGQALSHLRQVLLAAEAPDGMLILVGLNPLARQLLLMAAQVYQLQDHIDRCRFTSTLEQALEFIEQHRNCLASSSSV